MEDTSSYITVAPSRKQLIVALITGTIGFICGLTGICYALLSGFHFIDQISKYDHAFGVVFVVGVVLLCYALITATPTLRKNTT